METDLVLYDCNVLTMNPLKPRAEAIAIQGNRIVKVGTNEEILRLVGNSTGVIELNGLTVIPGLIDTHIHIADFGRFLAWLDLKNVKSINDMQKTIIKHAKQIPAEKWILGQGWSESNFDEKCIPEISDLDQAAQNHPVVLYHQNGSMCVVNSKALKLSGITKYTTSPDGGKIELDPTTGSPTGVLKENAMSLVWNAIPEPDEEELIELTRIACRKVVESGLTSVNWIVSSLSEIKIIKKLHAENKLPIRVYIIFPVKMLQDVNDLVSPGDFDDVYLRLGAINIFVDGYLAERTAYLKEPYSDDPSAKGELFYTSEEFKNLICELHEAGYQLVIHAMGDQAIDMAISALEKILEKSPKINHRYRIEQAAVLNQDLIQRLKKLRVSVAVQPSTIISEFTSWSAIERLGPERARWLYPLKSLLNQGILISGGSDCPMEKINPFSSIQAAITREFFPEESITVDQALKMYTVNAAYSSFDEKIKGSIEEGKLADLVVISSNPLTIQPDKIESIETVMTIIDGKIVYKK